MTMDEADARRHVEGGSDWWALTPIVVGFLAIAAPLLCNWNAMGMAFGVTVSLTCATAGLGITSGRTGNGFPPFQHR